MPIDSRITTRITQQKRRRRQVLYKASTGHKPTCLNGKIIPFEQEKSLFPVDTCGRFLTRHHPPIADLHNCVICNIRSRRSTSSTAADQANDTKN